MSQDQLLLETVKPEPGDMDEQISAPNVEGVIEEESKEKEEEPVKEENLPEDGLLEAEGSETVDAFDDNPDNIIKEV